MSKRFLSLKQAEYRTHLATSVFSFILEKSQDECSIDVNNLILLARDIAESI
ncbi:hypothetical protein PSI15_09550 [Xenorhabdus sp. PR6a]|uniref:hypothetical protein n=1 Tax=Xenorhabdus sp. PR6a TaxID=3025877 RepID=UPI00235A16C8|nr:hypothetical protein [Xenorhabdus sp. PR6a]MDC9581809.1 hypothetical protein [Xenorhabdus sp. PR6a]